MNYSLIHPSRGRCQMAWQAFQEWIGKASEQNQYEYILSIDTDDPQKECYLSQFKDTNIKLLISENRSMIDAVNVAAKKSTGDILICISDDFGCIENWDIEIEKIINRTHVVQNNENKPDVIGALKDIMHNKFSIIIDDTINGNQSGCMTLPILSRSAYLQLGHIYNPIYFSMFADNELHDVCKKNGWLVYSDLKFEHRHFINGKNPKDATYERENSKSAWDLGKKVYEERKKANFV